MDTDNTSPITATPAAKQSLERMRIEFGDIVRVSSMPAAGMLLSS